MQDMTQSLPPGFRFHPTDEELITCYLMKKVASSADPTASMIAEADIYKFNPWELPGASHLISLICLFIYSSNSHLILAKHQLWIAKTKHLVITSSTLSNSGLLTFFV